jgi:hypothetical protein
VESEDFFVVTAVAAVEDAAVELVGSAVRARRICRDYPITISTEMMFHCTSETRRRIGTQDTLPVTENTLAFFVLFFHFYETLLSPSHDSHLLYVVFLLFSLYAFLEDKHGEEAFGEIGCLDYLERFSSYPIEVTIIPSDPISNLDKAKSRQEMPIYKFRTLIAPLINHCSVPELMSSHRQNAQAVSPMNQRNQPHLTPAVSSWRRYHGHHPPGRWKDTDPCVLEPPLEAPSAVRL